MGRFILRKGRPRKDGKVTLTFSGHVHGHRIFAGTGLAVKPADWDDFGQQVRRTDTHYAQINARLRDLQARFDHEVASLEVVDKAAIERLKREFSRKGDETPEEPAFESMTLDFYDAFKKYLIKKQGLTNNSIGKYVSTLKTYLGWAEDRGPKWQFLSSHMARRTFVAISLECGMSPEVMMKVTGHRSFSAMKKFIALAEQSKSEAMESVWGR